MAVREERIDDDGRPSSRNGTAANADSIVRASLLTMIAGACGRTARTRHHRGYDLGATDGDGHAPLIEELDITPVVDAMRNVISRS